MTDLSNHRRTRGVLTVIAVLLGVIAIELWHLAPPLLSDARAQIPDSGKQRQDLVREVQTTNQLLKQISLAQEIENQQRKEIKLILKAEKRLLALTEKKLKAEDHTPS